ncbi:MAG TPA: class I SAM-dependent methyltransferase [Bacteroidales bacterium]|nr:class I SAM-dependent methyltransferase [Bacteroidales bacterium]
MQYDPIKKSLGKLFNKTPFLRILFYKLLDTLFLRTWHVKKEIREWGKNRKGKQRILDAGSGFGQYTFFMSGMNKKWTVEAVDVKEEQIADCNAFFTRIGRNNVVFGIADLTTYNRPETFDMILSVDVMEHIEDDEQVFRNFCNALTWEGMLLISTPSDQGGSDVHDHGEEASFIDEHVRDGYNIEEIQEKLKRAGFTKTSARYVYGKSGQIGWRLSMKYPILMLNASKLFFILLPFYYILTFPFVLIFNWMDITMKHKTGTGLIVKAFK